MVEGRFCILIADDEPEIRDVLRLLLEGEGYEVREAKDGTEAEQLADENVDLMILDVSMPGQSGIMAAVQIRKKSDAPIFFLTAFSGEQDKVMGFSAGADDYIVKPFSNIELLMRVKAALRRAMNTQRPVGNSAGSEISFAGITLDTERKTVIKDGASISLTYTEYRILELMVRNRGRIFSLDEIYRSIWDDEPVGDSSIMVHIKNIRKKLGDNSRNPVYIRTAGGRGYYGE